MRPVFQTIFSGVLNAKSWHEVWAYDPDFVPGNCLQAAVASIFDLPLESVPHFGNDRRPGAASVWLAMREWARERGRDFRLLSVEWDTLVDVEYLRVLAEHGIGPRYVVAFGESLNGYKHAVVWDVIARRVVHDPTPDSDGIDPVDGLMIPCDPYDDPDPQSEYEAELRHERWLAERHEEDRRLAEESAAITARAIAETRATAAS